MYFQNYVGGQWIPGLFFGIGGFVFFAIIIWTIFWKGMALWKSAREGSKVWFVALLLVNTIGILEILYLYVFSKKSKDITGVVNK